MDAEVLCKQQPQFAGLKVAPSPRWFPVCARKMQPADAAPRFLVMTLLRNALLPIPAQRGSHKVLKTAV